MHCSSLSHPCPTHAPQPDGLACIAASIRKNLTGISFAIALLGLIVVGEIWAIEHAPELIESCNSALSSHASPSNACRIESPVATIY